ncbi:MAG: hypothetical protein Phog2KO_31530 [Phototrophicaceae bacterium]
MLLSLASYRNSKKQGDIGLVLEIAWFEINDYPVSIPLTDSQDYDLIIDMSGTLKKVQVRTTYNQQKSGSYEVNLRVMGGNRSGTGQVKYFIDTDVDYLFIVVENGAKYFIPKSNITNKRAINIFNDRQYEQYRVE